MSGFAAGGISNPDLGIDLLISDTGETTRPKRAVMEPYPQLPNHFPRPF